MTGRVVPMPFRYDERHGTVCVMGDPEQGFLVGHESRSGDSWGNFLGPFDTGQEAIAAAYALNRDEYGGECNVSVCKAARFDGLPVKFAMLQEDF